MTDDDPAELSLKAERTQFNTQVAPLLAGKVYRGATRVPLKASKRFAYFECSDELIIVSGVQEKRYCDLALAYGLTLAKGKQLVVVLPLRYALATLQRAAFLKSEARPIIWAHDVPLGGAVPVSLQRQASVTRKAALARLTEKLGSTSPTDELADASVAIHLGDRGAKVADLVEWATRHADLGAAHRRGERSWHCMGQRVLSIRPIKGKALAIRAGIHYSSEDVAPEAHELPPDTALTPTKMQTIQDAVHQGISDRHDATGAQHRYDEHWLQAIIRRNPKLVGVEQPALREVPAWRPVGGDNKWGRGYIDLLGMDGKGDLRIVETKIAANKDDLLVFQGLDYYIWATVWGEALRKRLGATKEDVPLIVDFG
ncbi:MAG: hypothetical protein ACR2MN_15095 [Acidimicrobiales bacterium]